MLAWDGALWGEDGTEQRVRRKGDRLEPHHSSMAKLKLSRISCGLAIAGNFKLSLFVIIHLSYYIDRYIWVSSLSQSLIESDGGLFATEFRF